MTFFGMALLSAAGTIVLAVFAIVTAWYARRAFLKQSKKVSDQAEMLELQRRQLAEQEKTTAKQVEVLELQAVDLRESLNERKQEAEDRRRAQAAQVAAWFAWAPVTDGMFDGAGWGATVRNASGLPIYDISVFFHTAEEPVRGLGWIPAAAGSSTESIRVLPPMSERHLAIPPDVARQREKCDANVYVVSIWFTDAGGNRWERDPRGALKPLS